MNSSLVKVVPMLFFSFWSLSGGCHLSSEAAVIEETEQTVTAGPRTCSGFKDSCYVETWPDMEQVCANCKVSKILIYNQSNILRRLLTIWTPSMEDATTTACPWGVSARGRGRRCGAPAKSWPQKLATTTLAVMHQMQFVNVEVIRYNHNDSIIQTSGFH